MHCHQVTFFPTLSIFVYAPSNFLSRDCVSVQAINPPGLLLQLQDLLQAMPPMPAIMPVKVVAGGGLGGGTWWRYSFTLSGYSSRLGHSSPWFTSITCHQHTWLDSYRCFAFCKLAELPFVMRLSRSESNVNIYSITTVKILLLCIWVTLPPPLNSPSPQLPLSFMYDALPLQDFLQTEIWERNNREPKTAHYNTLLMS